MKALIQDPTVPRVEGTPPAFIEKEHDSFYVDARVVGRGRIRDITIEEAKTKGLPIAKEIAKEGAEAIQLPPEERRIHVIAKQALAPFGIAVDAGSRQLAEILTQLKGVPYL
ncbi:MAG: putative Site-specific recombinase XerC [Pedosphaera sp.]|nr:putative Site-specific recombinase XerC [Pedosphaera sp.]